jgi:hypothetical protein
MPDEAAGYYDFGDLYESTLRFVFETKVRALVLFW